MNRPRRIRCSTTGPVRPLPGELGRGRGCCHAGDRRSLQALSRALLGVVLGIAVAIGAAGGCTETMGPQPIPTPAVDPELLVFELEAGEILCVSGSRSAVQPPGALVEVVNLANVDRVVVRSDADGSFGPVCLSAHAGDVIRVTAIDDDPVSDGGSTSVDVELRPTGGAGDADAGTGAGRADAGAAVGDANGPAPSVIAVPVVDHTIACVAVTPSRLVLPVASNAPVAVVAVEAREGTAETAAVGETLERETAALSNAELDDGAAVAETARAITVSNGCDFGVRLVSVAARPTRGLSLRAAEPGVVTPGTRRAVFVQAAQNASTLAASAGSSDATATDATNTAATTDTAALADPGTWLIELRLAPEDAEDPSAHPDVRRVIVVSCDDPTAAADRATCGGPAPTADVVDGDAGRADVVGPGSRDSVVGDAADANAVARDTVRPPADTNTGIVGTRDVAAPDVPVPANDIPADDVSDPGVIPADVASAGAACRGEADRTALADVRDPHAIARRCAFDVCPDAGRACVVGCIQGDVTAVDQPAATVALSRDCAACFADEAICARDDCAPVCAITATADDARCAACIADRCAPAFERCSGLSPSPAATFDAAQP